MNKYEVVIKDANTPLKKRALTRYGRITEMCSDGLTVRIDDASIMIDDAIPIIIQLKEVARPKPDETKAWYQSKAGEEQYLNDLTEWSEHIVNLKTYDVSDELADIIIEVDLKELEEGKDFELFPDLQSWVEGTDTCSRYVAVEIEKQISWEADKAEEPLYRAAQDYAVKSHSPNMEARRRGFADGAFWQIQEQEKQFLSDKVNFLLANAMRRLSQEERILLRDKLSRRLPKEEAISDNTTRLKEQIGKLRDELYEAIPTGKIDAFALTQVVNDHIKKLDTLTEATKEEAVSEDDGLMDIPPPIGDFIIKNATGVMSDNGMLYHYSEVCNLLKRYKETGKNT